MTAHGGAVRGAGAARAIQVHVLVAADAPAIRAALAGARLGACVDAARDALRQAMARLDVGRTAAVALVVADDAYLHALNHRYRGLDRPTDVLSFRSADGAPFPTGGASARHDLGDIVVSLPYAARSAAARQAPLVDEMRLLAVHGLLHLLGHDDADDAGAARMRAEEVRLGVRAPDDEAAVDG